MRFETAVLSSVSMKTLFTEKANRYELRNKRSWETYNVRTVIYGTETIRNRGPKTWDHVPTEIKELNSLLEFKERIKMWKPKGCTCRLCKSYINNLGFL